MRRTKVSGLSGLQRVPGPDGPAWRATLTITAGLRRAAFPVARYGEAGAGARAVAQCPARLAALPPA